MSNPTDFTQARDLAREHCAALSGWPDALALTPSQWLSFSRECDSQASRAARLSAYAESRSNGHDHARAIWKADKVQSKVLRALGYAAALSTTSV